MFLWQSRNLEMAYTSLSKKEEEEEELHKKEMTRLELERDRKLDIVDKQVNKISFLII